MQGLVAAVNGADPQSTLYLFSDASAKDSELFANVNAMANQKNIKLKYGLFGSCSPIDPGFLATAAATGGQVFVLNRFSEAGALFPLVAAELGLPPVVETFGELPRGLDRLGRRAPVGADEAGGRDLDLSPVEPRAQAQGGERAAADVAVADEQHRRRGQRRDTSAGAAPAPGVQPALGCAFDRARERAERVFVRHERSMYAAAAPGSTARPAGARA